MSLAFPRGKWSEPAWSGPDFPTPAHRPLTEAEAQHIREQINEAMRRIRTHDSPYWKGPASR